MNYNMQVIAFVVEVLIVRSAYAVSSTGTPNNVIANYVENYGTMMVYDGNDKITPQISERGNSV